MCERTVRIMAEEASGRPKLVAGGAACGGEVVTPTSKPPKTNVNKDTLQVRQHGREPVTKGTVKTRIDFTGKPSVE